MKINIRYTSRTGNTKKLADANGSELDIDIKTASTPLDEYTDILFLGSALYALQLDTEMINFIKTLSPNNVGKIYCFSTTSLLQSSYNTLSKALLKQGLKPEKLEFHCRGKFGALYAERPNKTDIKNVKIFAKKAIKIR